MTSPIEPSLFDFVETFAGEVADGSVTGTGTVEESSAIIDFCESFFDQFFANVVRVPILGFGPTSKALAARAAVDLRDDEMAKPVRSLIALFEKFCDLHGGVTSGAVLPITGLLSADSLPAMSTAFTWKGHSFSSRRVPQEPRRSLGGARRQAS